MTLYVTVVTVTEYYGPADHRDAVKNIQRKVFDNFFKAMDFAKEQFVVHDSLDDVDFYGEDDGDICMSVWGKKFDVHVEIMRAIEA